MDIVNGFRCANCTDVDYAKRNIDPKHPKDGPFGVNAAKPPQRAHGPAVRLDGALARRLEVEHARPDAAARTAASPVASPGARVDVAA